MSAVERLLALARWRWTPLAGLTGGTATLVVGMATLVPERFGDVLEPPARRAPSLTAPAAPPQDTDVEPAAENGADVSRPARSAASSPRGARAERRRGFSPVIRPDEPPARAAPTPTPPETEDEAVAQIEQVQRTEEEQRRWSEGQAAASRAATRAARHASAVAGRPFGPNRRGVAAPGTAETAPQEPTTSAAESADDPVDDNSADDSVDHSAQPARPPEDDGQNSNAPPLDTPDEDVE